MSAEKKRLWGLGDLGAMFIVNLKRVGQKLRRFMLLHFGLVAFRIHVPHTQKVIMCMVVGPSGRDHDAQNQSEAQ